MNRHLFFIPIIISFCLLGCSNPLSLNNQNPLEVKTDKTHYNLNTDDSVNVTITNRSSETINYSTCFAKTIEVIKENKIIKTTGTPVCRCICPAELKPGTSIPVQISSLSSEIFKSRLENSITDGSVSYQIQYNFYYDEAFGSEPVSPEHSRSNTFTITDIK